MNIDSFIKNIKPDIRTLQQMQEVIYDQEWLKSADFKMPLYYMYRGVGKNEADKKKIAAAGLRYDITIIPAQLLGCEFVKTAGHSHNQHFPEIYEVLEGEAIYLMQKTDSKCHPEFVSASHVELSLRGGYSRRGNPEILKQVQDDTIQDAYIVKANAGDKVIIPPDYTHITINAGAKDLKMSNWIALGNISSNDEIKKRNGGCYFATKGFWGIKWIKNKNYAEIPKLRKQQPTNFKEIGFDKNIPMYKLARNLDKLDFLRNPQNFEALWKKILDLSC